MLNIFTQSFKLEVYCLGIFLVRKSDLILKSSVADKTDSINAQFLYFPYVLLKAVQWD